MRIHHRLTAFLFLTLLVVGCGKKPGSDANPTPVPNPTPGAQPPATPPGLEGTYLIAGGEIWGEKLSDTPTESELDRTVKVSKDQIQFKFLFKREIVQYKLDSSKSPQEIDIFGEKPSEKTKGNHGIYKVEGDILTLFIMGAAKPELRPREFKTLELGKEPETRVGGFMILTLKKVSNDTTFISEPPPKPPEADQDGPLAAELTKKGFIAEKTEYGKKGVNVTVPSTLPVEALKALNGQPRIRMITFKKVEYFKDPDHPVTDEAIQGLNKLDGLTLLQIEYCPKLTGAAFRDLSRFPMLTEVHVSGTPMDDAATEELTKVKMLDRVNLDGTKFTDKSLANLAKSKTLKNLWVRDAKGVTASGIKQLIALPDLEFLALQGVPAADAALGELNLPKLEFLNLAKSDITDDGFAKLPVLPKLRNLTLSGLKFTDAGLQHLQKQPNLESVTFFETKATKAGAEAFKKLKPKLSITVIE